MLKNIIKLNTFFLLILILIGQLVFAQVENNILSKTIIFKVSEQHRVNCNNNTIKIDQFNLLLNEIGVNKLAKVFPNKREEQRSGYVDLSLIYELTYTNSFKVNEVIQKLEELKIAEYIEPYYLPQLTYTPNDTLLSNQYYINLINADDAWNVTTGDTNIVIGITDTGWDPIHSDLVGNVKINYADPINGVDDDADGYMDNYLGWDLGMNDNDALWESLSHGVNVTGIAAAVTDNVTGISGVGFNTKFLPIKISNSVGVLTQAYQGIIYAADHGCFVINCSWGGYDSSQFAKNIIDYAIINKGCLIVAAAGNDNSDNIFYPAGYDGVFSVAATDQNDIKLTTSNYGSYIDISAPGGAIFTTGPNGYSTNSGTSMAAPVVSGGAALLKSHFPSYTNNQIATLMRVTADDLNVLNPSYVNKLGGGRLNLFNAVTSIVEENKNSLQIYPNPSKGIVVIKSDEKIDRVIVRNILGQIIEDTIVSKIDISNQPNGVYFVQIMIDKIEYVEKVILNK